MAETMFEYRVRRGLSREWVAKNLEGKLLTESSRVNLVQGMCSFFDPSGRRLCVYLPGAIKDEMDAAYEILTTIRATTENRGMASATAQRVRQHNQMRGIPVTSSIVGAFEASGFYSKQCRLTSWTNKQLTDKWPALFPLFQACAKLFEEYAPERFEAQMRYVERTKPDWIIEGTPFTTCTVNNCVDASTECLTKRGGWTTYDQVLPTDELLAYDPEAHTTRWEPLQDVFINERYRGDMVLLSNSRFSALTTPDHRWPVRRTPDTYKPVYRSDSVYSLSKRGPLNPMYGVSRYSSGWDVFTSEELPREGWGIVRKAPYEGPEESVYSNAFVKLCAWLMTEGSIGADGKRFGLAQSVSRNPAYVNEIREDLAMAGASPLEKKPYSNKVPGVVGNVRRDGLHFLERQANQFPEVISWGVSGTGVDPFLDCFSDDREKVPKMEFLTALTSDQAKLFVETCFKGDGTKATGQFGQHHKGRMDAYTIAAVLAGYAPSLQCGGNACSTYQTTGELVWLPSVKRQTIQYAGTVWCPSLPSGHWVARRNGKTFITGNSYPTGVHLDDGDLDSGFSVLAVARKGKYTGGILNLPEYGLGVDLQHGDVLLMNAHAYHGNTPLFCACGKQWGKSMGHAGTKPCPDCGAERISVVLYYRTNMTSCGTKTEEDAKAQAWAEKISAGPVAT